MEHLQMKSSQKFWVSVPGGNAKKTDIFEAHQILQMKIPLVEINGTIYDVKLVTVAKI